MPHVITLTVSWHRDIDMWLWCHETFGSDGPGLQYRWCHQEESNVQGATRVLVSYGFARADDATLFELTWC
jgi:hypothetical protein